MKIHYLYRHIRLDKNEPFYIGIGNYEELCLNNKKYKRAYSKYGRSKFWKDIVNKSEYKTQIILESTDYNFILKKENEFVELYGRKDLKTGTLCNLQPGGRWCPVGGKVKGSGQKSMLQYDLEGNFIKEYKTLADASRFVKANVSQIHRSCKNSHGTAKGFQWRYKKENDILEKISKFTKKEKPHGKPVLQFNKTGEFIKKWNSAYEASKCLNINKDCIENVCRKLKHNNSYKTFIWKFEDNLKSI